MLEGKTVVLGVSGGIAAYKIPNLTSMLVKQGADVNVIMTANAQNFITATTFETLTGNKCLIDTFDRNFSFQVEHVALAKRADIFLIAPATANVIAKIAHGIADDMLTTTFLAAECPKLIAPAMNTHMFENPVTQDNIAICKKYGMKVIEPASGRLACGDTGAGKMPEPADLFAWIERELSDAGKACGENCEKDSGENDERTREGECGENCEKDLSGRKVLVTAGPTREAIDPVRYISNHSTGKMGYAIAAEAARRGAEVTLVSGPVALAAPEGVKVVPIVSAHDLFEAVTAVSGEQDIIIKAAAVADYRPAVVATEKTKKGEGETALSLVRTEDTLAWLGQHRRPGQFLCGFSMETEHVLENSRAKLEKKHIDMIVANNLKVEGAGFGTDTNVVTLITADDTIQLERMSKTEVARHLLDRIIALIEGGQTLG